MAQLGSMVPARECRLSVVDKIYTRLGAEDSLLTGKSTFYLEMEETKLAVDNCTDRSLVIMDELGRGTSTYDGVSIAFAIIDELIKRKCCTMFATRYHVLLGLTASSPEVAYFKMGYLADEDDDEILFTYQFVEGVCSRSFGLEVAKRTGLDPRVISESKERARMFDDKITLVMQREILGRSDQILQDLLLC